jgi:4'-phosphopantetheinyl transferase
MVPEGVIELWRLGGSAGPPARSERHAALRQILGRHLEVNPAELAFARGAHGKPRLVGVAADRGLEFSYADSGDIAVVAVTSGRPVGVDVEGVDPRRPVERLARRWFAPTEAAALAALHGPARAAGFHRLWAAKEAGVKGIGRGLGFGIARVVIPTAAGSDGDHVVAHPAGPLAGWTVWTLREACGFAAVAAPGRDWRVVPRTLRVQAVAVV